MRKTPSPVPTAEQLELDLEVGPPPWRPPRDEASIKEPNPQDVCAQPPSYYQDEPEQLELNLEASVPQDDCYAAQHGATYVPDYTEAYRESLKHEAFEGPTDPFSTILSELQVLHNRKRADYGSKTDPYANVRASAEFGIPPWIGVMVRANDKVKRIKAAATGSTMQNESIIDSFNDLAVYAIIARILYEAHESLEKAIKDGYVSEAQVS